MVRDGLFSFRCVCRLELERSGCVRRGPPAGAGAPPAGAGAPPSGGRYGRARKGVRRAPPANVEQRVPPLGWARARSLPRALRALAPTRPAVHYFTVSVHHQFRYSFAQITRRNHLATHVFTRHRRSTLRQPRHWSAPQSCSDPNLLGLEASTSHSHPHVVPALSAASAVSLQSRSPGLATRRPRPRPLRSHLVLSDLISDLIWSSQISSHPLSEVAGVGLELLLDALEIRLSLVRVDALL